MASCAIPALDFSDDLMGMLDFIEDGGTCPSDEALARSFKIPHDAPQGDFQCLPYMPMKAANIKTKSACLLLDIWAMMTRGRNFPVYGSRLFIRDPTFI
jgi:hypothetical protein